jgi:CRP-like cAMP-binding protein
MYFPSKTYQVGDVLFTRGDAANTFYMIESGEVDLFVPPANTFLVRLGPGEAFGEQAILTGGIRSATAIAVTELTCVEMTAESLQDMIQSQKTLIRPAFEALLLQLYLQNSIRSALPELNPSSAQA